MLTEVTGSIPGWFALVPRSAHVVGTVATKAWKSSNLRERWGLVPHTIDLHRIGPPLHDWNLNDVLEIDMNDISIGAKKDLLHERRIEKKKDSCL